MTNYTPYGVTLTKGQIQKLKNTYDSDTDATLRISKKDLSGPNKLPLTQTQINKIRKATTGVQLCISKSQLEHMEKHGGFLPLLALIPAIAAAAAGVGGLAGGISSAVNSTRQTNEQVRHNKEVEKQLGSGLLSDAVAPIPIAGKMLSNVLKKFGLGGLC